MEKKMSLATLSTPGRGNPCKGYVNNLFGVYYGQLLCLLLIWVSCRNPLVVWVSLFAAVSPRQATGRTRFLKFFADGTDSAKGFGHVWTWFTDLIVFFTCVAIPIPQLDNTRTKDSPCKEVVDNTYKGRLMRQIVVSLSLSRQTLPVPLLTTHTTPL